MSDVSRETTIAEVVDEYKRLQEEVRVLLRLIDHEVGPKRFRTFEMNLQIEKLEELLRLSFDG